jgi:uncharacterized protein YecT (DUF1311 family)
MSSLKSIIFLLLFTNYLFAQALVIPLSTLYTGSYDSCMKNAISTNDFLSCIEKEYLHHDKLLNTTYKEVKLKLAPFRVKDLRNMQRKWIAYKDAKCGFYYHKQSGRIGLESSSLCQLNETILRTVELKELY